MMKFMLFPRFKPLKTTCPALCVLGWPVLTLLNDRGLQALETFVAYSSLQARPMRRYP
jgi:hypothetical protein